MLGVPSPAAFGKAAAACKGRELQAVGAPPLQSTQLKHASLQLSRHYACPKALLLSMQRV